MATQVQFYQKLAVQAVSQVSHVHRAEATVSQLYTLQRSVQRTADNTDRSLV